MPFRDSCVFSQVRPACWLFLPVAKGKHTTCILMWSQILVLKPGALLKPEPNITYSACASSTMSTLISWTGNMNGPSKLQHQWKLSVLCDTYLTLIRPDQINRQTQSYCQTKKGVRTKPLQLLSTQLSNAFPNPFFLTSGLKTDTELIANPLTEGQGQKYYRYTKMYHNVWR